MDETHPPAGTNSVASSEGDDNNRNANNHNPNNNAPSEVLPSPSQYVASIPTQPLGSTVTTAAVAHTAGLPPPQAAGISTLPQTQTAAPQTVPKKQPQSAGAPSAPPSGQNKLQENLNASLHKGLMNRMEYSSIHEVVGRVKVCAYINLM